jgi:hypothetical protein
LTVNVYLEAGEKIIELRLGEEVPEGWVITRHLLTEDRWEYYYYWQHTTVRIFTVVIRPRTAWDDVAPFANPAPGPYEVGDVLDPYPTWGPVVVDLFCAE